MTKVVVFYYMVLLHGTGVATVGPFDQMQTCLENRARVEKNLHDRWRSFTWVVTPCWQAPR